MEWFSNPEIWVGLLTLTTLEVVLGIDNVVFISILASKLPDHQQAKARQAGLSLAMLTRIALLFSLSWVIGFTSPLLMVFGQQVTGRDLILIGGGLFLLAKSTREIHNSLEGPVGHAKAQVIPSFMNVMVQILLLDLVFSLDSVITAVGMVEELGVMIAAVVIAVVIMVLSAEAISGFVKRHPTVKILALSFLLLIGMSLIAEGMNQHIPKGYIYFGMAFSIFVEFLNIRLRSRKHGDPVLLHKPFIEEVTTIDANQE
ncbi:MAG: TerC family protein [Candidatus Heimdallarchaeota archaeon]|nr:TerC family protein [Candidatus Heimdallarchaeota archaeon]